jgi:hypothetical protein
VSSHIRLSPGPCPALVHTHTPMDASSPPSISAVVPEVGGLLWCEKSTTLALSVSLCYRQISASSQSFGDPAIHCCAVACPCCHVPLARGPISTSSPLPLAERFTTGKVPRSSDAVCTQLKIPGLPSLPTLMPALSTCLHTAAAYHPKYTATSRHFRGGAPYHGFSLLLDAQVVEPE